jgi:hypothetical protein
MVRLSAELEALGLSREDKAELKAFLEKEGISDPLVIREYRKRGPVYYSIIFDSARHSTQVFGLPPLKMANFKGIYLADSADYSEKVSKIAEKLRNPKTMRLFSEGKNRAANNLNSLVSKFGGKKFETAPERGLHALLKEFYETRYPYTQYSFLFSTVTKSTEKLLKHLFQKLGIPEKEMYLAYVPSHDTIEFTYLKRKNWFLKKHARALKKLNLDLGRHSQAFIADLQQLLEDFGDLHFVCFEMPLEAESEFLEKILKRGVLEGKVSELKRLQEKKQVLLLEALAEAQEKGLKQDYVEALFEFAGNLSAWESKARHTWTRLHRKAKPLIEEVAKRASEKGLIESPEQIYQKEILEIISLAEKLCKS